MKKTSAIGLLAVTLLSCCAVGCASDPDPTEESFPAPKDQVMVAASEETKRETGIESNVR